MKRLKNKKTLLFGGILCAGVAILGVSVAYNHDSSTFNNEFGLGAYEVVTSELFTSPNNWKPCDETTKTLTVQNKSDVDIKVRVKYDEVWRNAADTRNLPLVKDNVTLANVVLQNTNDWELKGDGYYYYKNALAPNAITSSLFDKVVLDCNANFGANNVCTETANGTVCSKPADDYEAAKYHLKITAESVQADAADEEWSFALLDRGYDVNQDLRSLAGNNLQSIAVVDTLPNTIDPTTAAKTDIAFSGTDPIYAYYDGNHNIYIHADGRTLYAHKYSMDMFRDMPTLVSLTLSSRFNTSLVISMSGMFLQAESLSSLTLPESFDTSSVEDMSEMFLFAYGLSSLTLPESFDTSSVKYMSGMFAHMTNLSTLTLPSSFDTSSVIDMHSMFVMSGLTSLTLPASFDTSSVTNMSGVFGNLSSLTSLTLPASFNTSSVTNMDYLFYNMSSLTSLTLPSSFVINSGVSTTSIFSGVPSTATLNSNADASVRALWPGQLRS